MTTRPRRSLVLVLISAAIVSVQLLQTSPARAHEFTLLLIGADVGAAADAARGFRLAVDRSPDVSHPPGEDAGDHLGGVDVDIVSVDTGLPSATDEVNRLLDSGATAVVVLTANAVAEAAIASAVARGTVVVAVGGSAGTEAGPGEIRLRSGGRADQRRFDQFAAAFAEAFGSAPTDAATLGYDAGTLVDRVVSELGEHLEPGPALDEAAAAAADDLVLAEVDVVSDASTTGEVASDVPPAREGRTRAVLTAAAASSVVLVLGAAMVARRRRRRRLSV